MKSEGKIKQKMRDAKYSYLKRAINTGMKRTPCNCQHNDSYNVLNLKDEGPLRLCMYNIENPGQWSGNVCDEAKTAQECPYFTPVSSVESIKSEFKLELEDPIHVAEQYKDLAALNWVLETKMSGSSITKFQSGMLFLRFQLYMFLHTFSNIWPR